MGDKVDRDAAIAFLSSQYAVSASRDGSLMQTMLTAAGIAATVLGGIVFGIKEYRPDGSGLEANPWLYLALPLAPTVLLGILVFLALHIILNAQYVHALESHMAALSGERFSPSELRVPRLSVEIPSLLRLDSKLFGAGRKPHTRLYSGIVLIIIVTVAGLLVGVPALKLRNLSSSFKVAATLIYLPINVLAFAALLRALRPNRALLRDALLDVVDTPHVETPQRARRLSSYLLAPRTVDHALKVVVAVVGTLLGRLALASRGEQRFWSWATVGSVALVVVIVEYLVYQGRYTWNDLRDLPHDVRHPRKLQRRRIPVPISRGELRVLWVSIPVKLVLATVIVRQTAPQHAGRFLLAGAAVWMSALTYEGLRQTSQTRNRTVLDPSTKALSFAVCVVVGAGYAIRVVTALEVGSDGRIPFEVSVLFGATLWLSQVATVAMAWVLEGAEFLHRDEAHGTGMKYDPALRAKAHLGLMLFQAGIITDGSGQEEAPLRRIYEVGTGDVLTSVPQPRNEAVCGRCRRRTCARNRYSSQLANTGKPIPGYKPEDRNAATLSAPSVPRVTIWSAAGALGFIAAAAAATVASNGMSIPASRTIWLATAAGLPAAAQCLLRFPFLAGFVFSEVSLTALGVWAEMAYPWLAPLLFFVLVAVYEMIRTTSYEVLVGWLDKASQTLRILGARAFCSYAAAVRWFGGGWCWDDLEENYRKTRPPSPRRDIFVRREK